MARYIDADKLKERLKDFSKWCRDGRKQGVDFVLDCPLPDSPDEAVVPVKESEWLPSPDGVAPIRCKECNTPAPFLMGEDDFGNEIISRHPFKYCPYCGAKMKGGAE